MFETKLPVGQYKFREYETVAEHGNRFTTKEITIPRSEFGAKFYSPEMDKTIPKDEKSRRTRAFNKVLDEYGLDREWYVIEWLDEDVLVFQTRYAK